MMDRKRLKFGKSLPHISFLHLAPLLAACLASGAAHAADPKPPVPLHLKGVVLTPAGKPVADAQIVYALVDYRTQMVVQEQTLHPAADGTFDIAALMSRDTPQFPLLYVTAPEGVALPTLNYHPNGDQRMVVTLTPATQVHVRLRDEAGRPLSGVRVFPLAILKDRDYRPWDGEAVTDHLSAVTDASGMATLTGLPQGWTLRLAVAGTGWVQPDWSQNIALAKAPGTPDAAVQVAHGGSLSGTVVYGPGKPAAFVVVTAVPLAGGGGRQDGTTDASGRYQITGMPRGSYTVSIEAYQGAPSSVPWPWTAAAQTAAVVPGGQNLDISFTLIHGGVLSGVVSDAKTGKPISGVGVYVDGSGGGGYARTDDAGRYSLHVPPGGQQVFLEADPGMTAADPQRVVVADGQTQTVNFLSTPPLHPAVVRGLVVGPTGKPVAGAKVTAAGQSQQEQDTQQVTDAQGRFTFDAPGLMPDMRLYAAGGGMSTPAGTPAADGSKPLTLRLAAQAGLVVRGRVTTAGGKPVAGASATLYREHASSQDGIGVATTKTNAAGQYLFTPAVPDATYQVGVQADGYGYQFTKQVKHAVGTLMSFAPLALPRTDSFVGGTVVDKDGKPIAGADVSLMSATDKHTQTDAQGRFHLAGATRGKAIVEVQAAQGRYASLQVASGRDDLQITAVSVDEQTVESRFSAAVDADKTNHGDGTNAHVLLRSACTQAAQQHKKVLLVFHASWCGPCFLLHRFLEDPQVKPIMDAHFVVQNLDIWENKPEKAWENPGGDALYKQYGGVRPSGDKQGVPFFAVLTPTGTSLGDARMNGDNVGYPSDPAAADFFLKMLRASAPSLTAEEAATLKASLQRNAKI